MTFTPVESKAATSGPSPLEQFRLSPLYTRLRMKKYKDRLYNSDTSFTPATLQESAEKKGKEGGSKGSSFVSSVIALLIDAGYDDNLVEVLQVGRNVQVYLDDRIGSKTDHIRGVLANIGEVEMVAKPEDDPTTGTYVYLVQPTTGRDPGEVIQRISQADGTGTMRDTGRGFGESKKQRRQFQGKGVAPQSDTTDCRGRRVLHDKDKTECFTPYAEGKNTGLSPVSVTPSRPQHDFHPSDSVWVLGEGDAVLSGVVAEVHGVGTTRHYLVRLADGSYVNTSSAYATAQELVDYENRYRSLKLEVPPEEPASARQTGKVKQLPEGLLDRLIAVIEKAIRVQSAKKPGHIGGVNMGRREKDKRG